MKMEAGRWTIDENRDNGGGWQMGGRPGGVMGEREQSSQMTIV
jgi:hypothetical protein